MKKPVLALLLALLPALSIGCAGPRSSGPATPEQAAVMVCVYKFVGAFNVGNTAQATAACMNEMSIIDEFPPYEWHGPGALSTWLADYATDAKQRGLSDGIVVVGTPRHIDVSADRAYVVAPAEYAFLLQGKPVQETDSTFLFTLQKTAAGWRITGWAWAKS